MAGSWKKKYNPRFLPTKITFERQNIWNIIGGEVFPLLSN